MVGSVDAEADYNMLAQQAKTIPAAIAMQFIIPFRICIKSSQATLPCFAVLTFFRCFSSLPHPEYFQDFCGGADAGEGRLDQVDANKGGEQ